MAEFFNLTKDPPGEYGQNEGFNAMGQPVPFYRRQAAYKAAREMGLNEADAFTVVNTMVEGIERDEPYFSMENGMMHVNLTGTYRLLAVLLNAHEGK